MPMLQTQINVVAAPASASPELSDRPRRRTFTAQDKLRILAATDRAAETGGIGAVLRREGLCSSTLSDWRRQRDAGAYGALVPGKRGPKLAEPNPFAIELAMSRRDNARLTQRLARAEAITDIQKKSRRCWASRWRPATACLDRRRRGARAGRWHDRRGLRRARGFACHSATKARPAGRSAGDLPSKAPIGPGADRSATAGGVGSAARATLRRPRSGLMQRQAVSALRRPPRFTPRCSMRAPIAVRSAPCSGSSTTTAKFANAANSCAIRFIKSRNFWRNAQMRFGPGTSPN